MEHVMPRARRKPSNPATEIQTTDTGPDTPAQRHGAVYRRPRDGRAGDVRRERQHPLDRMRDRGALTIDERERAMRASDLYAETQRGGGQLRERVDGRSDPDIGVVTRCEALFAYARAVRHVPAMCRLVFNHVVEDGRHLVSLRGCRTNAAERRRQWLLLRIAIAALDV